MNIREDECQENNLKYIQNVKKLYAHILQIYNNPKHFLKLVLTNQIKDEVIQTLCNLRYNLSAYILNKKDTRTLFKYQFAVMRVTHNIVVN